MRPVDADIDRCSSCRYYKSSFAAGPGTGIGGLEALRRANFERILDHLARLRALPGLRLLEVGCAKGWFLEAAQRRGAVVRGIEPELANQQIAMAAGFDVAPGLFPEAAGAGPYDVIVFNDVFEHLPDPVQGIQAVERLLEPGGLAVLNIPSSGGVFFAIAGVLRRIGIEAPWRRLWQYGLASPHISYFNASNLAQLARRHTRLAPVLTADLASLSREGLRDRVTSVNRGLGGELMLAGVWCATFFLERLPPDIVLVVLEKPPAAR